MTTFSTYGAIFATDDGSSTATSTVTITDTHGNDLGGVIATDIPIMVTATFSGINPPTGTTSLSSSLTFYYNDGSIARADVINSNGQSSPGSYWTNINQVYSTDLTMLTVTGILDLTSSKGTFTQSNIFANIAYVSGNDIITDSGINIVTDSGINITTD